jgi:hypothetical protein
MRGVISSEWLRERLSDNDIRALNDGGRDAYEHGLHRESVGWESIKRQFASGDEVWKYCSPMESWQGGQGEMGIAIVRRGAVVISVVASRSSNR